MVGGPFRAIDRVLLANAPRLWLARYHVAIPLSALVLCFGFFAFELSEIAYQYADQNFGHWLSTDVFGIAYATVFCVSLVVIGLILLRSQSRFMAIDRTSPGAAARAFTALFGPPFVAVSILFAIGALRDDDGLLIVTLSGIILAFVAAALTWGLCFAGMWDTLKGFGAALIVSNLFAAILIILNPSDALLKGVFHAFVIVMILLVIRWPRWLGRLLSSTVVVIFVTLMAGFVPFITAATAAVYLEGTVNDDLFFAISVLGFAPLILLLLPTLNQMQRRWIEPQDS
uniref:Uncharacterized protein n=1 Tax=Yoonia rhodophyticola TaxID=3137370 RepID=A0AAN0MLW1_9RHOB